MIQFLKLLLRQIESNRRQTFCFQVNQQHRQQMNSILLQRDMYKSNIKQIYYIQQRHSISCYIYKKHIEEDIRAAEHHETTSSLYY